MIKGLEALQDIRLRLFIESEVQSKKIVKDLKIIEKELKGYERMLKVFGMKELLNTERKLKALEIIYNKDLSVGAFKELDLEHYNMYARDILGIRILTKEEYDLLREVLKWVKVWSHL